MRIFKTIFTLCFTIFAFASIPGPAIAQQKGSRVRELSLQLTRSGHTEESRVRAIYDWITSNISYRVSSLRNISGSIFYGDTDDTGALKSLDERVADAVLDRGEAICEGYSRLFKMLCFYAGIDAELIHGYARGRRSGLSFSSNHTWNAVRINNQWKLVDVTWGSGFVTFNGSMFVRQQDDSWYMTSPETFAQDHFPDEPRWTLLNEIPIIPELRKSPFRQRAFIKYQIHSFFPQKGVISHDVGSVLRMEIQTNDMNRDRQVGPDTFLDTNHYQRPDHILLHPVSINNNRVIYEYIVESVSPKWICLLYNDDIILRYYLAPRAIWK